MKRFLCVAISIVLLLCLCGCNNSAPDNYSSEEIEIIYEEDVETVYEGGSSAISSEETPSQQENVSSDSKSSITTNTSNPQTSSEVTTIQESMYKLNDSQVLNNIKLNGRCEKTSAGINLNMAASAIEFNTDSSSALLQLDASSGVYYTVMVDGEITAHHQLIENDGTNYVVVARRLGAGTHNIKFIRDSESRSGMKITAVSIQLDDGTKLLSKDADKTIIEFLGDSLTSGYGNLIASGGAEPQALKNQSSTKAYPFLIANKLGYDYRIVSLSGIALGKREGYPTFPEFYGLENYHIDKTKKYTSSSPQDVDIVVVNLGTNDAGSKLYDEKAPASVEAYGKLYADLITNIGYRKDAKIVFVSGVCWCHTQTPAYNVAIQELKSRGYNNVYTVDVLTYQSGGDGHPSAAEHTKVADAIIKFFKDNGIAK